MKTYRRFAVLCLGLAVLVSVSSSAIAVEEKHNATLSEIQADAKPIALTDGKSLFDSVAVLNTGYRELAITEILTPVSAKGIELRERITEFGNTKSQNTFNYNAELVRNSLSAQEVGWRRQSAYDF
jgi:hypothetical protein